MLCGQFKVNAFFTNPFSLLELRDDGEVLQNLLNPTHIPILAKGKNG